MTRRSIVITIVVAGGLVASLTTHALRASALGPCKNSDLDGPYGFYRIGYTDVGATPAPLSPLAAVGIATFDGNGGLSTSQRTMKNGAFNPPLATPFPPPPSGTAKYAVGSDCSLTFSDTTGVFADGVVVDSGREVYLLSIPNKTNPQTNAVVVVATRIR